MNAKKIYFLLISTLIFSSCTKGEPEGITLIFTVLLFTIFVIAAFRTMFAENESNKEANGMVGFISLIAALLLLA